MPGLMVAAAAASGNGGRIEAWARSHKGAVALIAALGAVLAVLVLLMSHPKGRSAGQQMIKAMPGYSGGGIAGSSTPAPSPIVNPDSPISLGDWVKFGPGFNYVGTVPFVRGGMQYEWIRDPATAQALLRSGKQLFFSPSPGEFAPISDASNGAAYYWAHPVRGSTPPPMSPLGTAGPPVNSKTPADVFGGL